MRRTGTFRTEGPTRRGDFDVYEGRGVLDSGSDAFSCVALYVGHWQPKVPALGGTRWLRGSHGFTLENAVERAKDLAHAMYWKNTLLKHAAQVIEVRRGSAPGELTSLYHWQGGKGVIWSPQGVDHLESERLHLHGRLLESLGGIYVGSKDDGVGTDELRTIGQCTEHIIGLRCGRDTGEATAVGVVAGLRAACSRLAGGKESEPLAGKRVLVVGVGKVGLPLVRFLREQGCDVFLYDPHLVKDGATSEESVRAHYRGAKKRGAEVAAGDEAMLVELLSDDRIVSDEMEALTLPGLDVISPNGGDTEWLMRPFGGSTRAEVIGGRGDDDGVKLVLGAANDQLTGEAIGSLDRLAAAGWLFVPDTLVSPGGVIAVSHERREEWVVEDVNRDAREAVEVGVERFLDLIAARHGGLAGVPGELLWATFESMVDQPWDSAV